MADLSAQAIELPPALVLECATGLTGWDEIAKRFDFTPEQWAILEKWPPFITAVDAKREELRRQGVPFRIKAGLAAEDLLADVYKRAVGPDVSLLQKLEALKLMSKLADYEPKQNAGAGAAGPGFSIVINLPTGAQVSPAPQPATIDAVAKEVVPVRPVEPALPIYMRPDTPEFIEVPE